MKYAIRLLNAELRHHRAELRNYDLHIRNAEKHGERHLRKRCGCIQRRRTLHRQCSELLVAIARLERVM